MGAINNVSSVLMNQMLELAWAAGFVDGDGCIGIAKQRYKDRDKVCHRLKFSIVQNNLEVLQELQSIIGESSFISKLKRDSKSNRQAYALVYDSNHALKAIKKLKPFMRRKQYEAEIAIRMWTEGKMGKRPGSKGWTAEIYDIREKWAQKLSRLK